MSKGEYENTNGTALREALEEHRLFAASTATGKLLPTWFSGRNQDQGHRIDYIAVSRACLTGHIKAGTDKQVCLGGKEAYDHILAFAEVALPATSRGKRGGGAHAVPQKACPQLMADPVQQEAACHYVWGSCTGASQLMILTRRMTLRLPSCRRPL